MKSWEERWFEELDAATPVLSEDVKNAPIECVDASVSTREKTQNAEGNFFQKLFATKKSKIIGIASVCAAGLVGLSFAIPSWINPQTPPITASAQSDALLVEINPEAVFSVDKDGVVVSVMANNADADVILSSKARVEEMEGTKVERAVEIFVDYAAQLGFIDFATPDAVRISAGGENNVEKVRASLKDYFCEKGARIAIVTETLTSEKLCQRIGLETQTTEDLVETLKTLPVSYTRRQAESKEDVALESLYRDVVPVEKIQTYYEEKLKENVQKIEKNEKDLHEIAFKSEEIRAHRDNPWAIFGGGDYWTLKLLNAGEYTQEFSALMAEMQTLLSAYEAKYGVKIENLSDLENAARAINALPLETLKELLAEFTSEKFVDNYEMLSQILKNIGVDVSFSKDFYEPPKTLDEFIQKTEQFSSSRFEKMRGKNAEKYGNSLEKIDAQAYDDYINGVVAEYGSLSAYWDSLKK